MNGDTLNAGRVSVRRCAFLRSAKNVWRELMKKLGIMLLAAAFAVCGLMMFAACNEETPGPGDDPIVTPEPDEPDDPDVPGEPDEPDEQEATEGLIFDLIDGVSYAVMEYVGTSAEVYIPSTYQGLPVTYIGDEAFYGCSSLTSIRIPDSVTYIGYRVFYECSSLTSITIGNGVTTIGEWAFFDCSGLTSIKLPDSVTSVGGGAFYECSGLTSITIPDSVTSIGGRAFYGTAYYHDASNWEDGVLYIGNHLIEAENIISEDYSVREGTKTIAGGAFSGCYGLTSIVIPDSVTSIGSQAFYYCDGLTSITIPDSVTTIGDGAFSCCEGLTSIVIPDSVTSIGIQAFYDCDGLTSIMIPDSVTSIGWWAFDGCSSLTSIIVDPQNSVYHSDGNCLIETESKTLIAGCMTSVIPADGSVTEIGAHAFAYCDSLTSITIPDSVISIDNYAFNGCDSLTSVTIGDGVTSIGAGAFDGCSSLTSVTIPDSVTSIGDSAFYRCLGLTSIIVDPQNSVYHSDGNCLIETESKTLIAGCMTSVIPADGSVISIADFAFYRCSGLTSVTIPDSVISIGEWAFAYCDSLTSITIGDSVTSIGDYAFYDCDSLETVYYRGSEAEWNEIGIGRNNDELLNAEIVFNCSGE